MADSGPAAQVKRALVEDVAVAGREKVSSQDDKGVGPDQETMLHTPPLVIVKVALTKSIQEQNENVLLLKYTQKISTYKVLNEDTHCIA